jgi:hypothetical protein
MGLDDLWIDLNDKDTLIASLEDDLEAMTGEAWEVEELLIEVVPILRAVSQGKAYPTDKAKHLLNKVMDRVGCLVIPGLLLDHPPGGARPHLRLVKS